ncbi:unnamed protein product [Closterium sp. Naga37s-1]|nr:unnamed protein product [Closterium sp. Naga37s-1]
MLLFAVRQFQHFSRSTPKTPQPRPHPLPSTQQKPSLPHPPPTPSPSSAATFHSHSASPSVTVPLFPEFALQSVGNFRTRYTAATARAGGGMGIEEERSGDSHARDEENEEKSTMRVDGGEEKAGQGDGGDVHAALDAGTDESRVSASEESGNEGNQAETGGEAEGPGDRGDDAEEAAAPAAAVAGGGDAEAEAEAEAEAGAEAEAEEVVAVVVEEAEGADEKGDGEGEGGEGEEQAEEPAAEEEDGEDEDEEEDEDEDEEEGEEEEGASDGGKSEGAAAPGRRAAPRMSREARSIYERIRARPCRVARVIIAGNKRTKAAIISRIMAGALAELAEAQPAEAEAEAAGGSFEDLQSALLRANRALRGLGVFEDVTIVVDALPGDPPGTAMVVINVKEDSVLAANVGTYLQRDGRTSEARITLKNLLGYAESLDVSLGVGHDGASSSGISSWSILQTAGNSFALSLSCPLLLLPPSLQSLLPSPYSHSSSSSSSSGPAASPASDAPTSFPYVEMRLFKSTRSMLPYTSLSQCLRGATLGLHVGRHELAYELTWRENSAAAAATASPDSTTKTTTSTASSSSSSSGSGGGDGGSGGSGIAPAPALVRGVCSPAVQRDLGHSLLSAVRYIYSIDKRDSQVRPRTGYAMRATTELAGLGTDPKLVSFLRQELELATALPLPIANAAFTSSFRIGALLPWSLSSLSSLPALPSLPALSRSSQPPPPSATSAASPAPSSPPSPPHSLINDRFFLGGPSSLRGFQDHAVGPTAPRPAPSRARDFLGGDLSLSATTALSFDLPFLKPLQQAGVHGHVFASAGALLPLQSVSGAAGRAWGGGSVGGEGGGAAGGVAGGGVGSVVGRVVEVSRSVGREVLDAMRCTAGVGLVWPTLIGRLEVSGVGL